MKRDPPGVAAHHFNHHHSLMAAGGGVQFVDRFHGGRDRRVEAEGEIGPRQVVVDRLRYADHGKPHGVQFRRRPEGVLAADGDQCVQPEDPEILQRPLRPPGVLERIGARGSDDRPADVEDPGDHLAVQVHRRGVEEPLPSVSQPDHAGTERVGFPDHRPDHRVQARTIASAGQDPDLHRLRLPTEKFE